MTPFVMEKKIHGLNHLDGGVDALSICTTSEQREHYHSVQGTGNNDRKTICSDDTHAHNCSSDTDIRSASHKYHPVQIADMESGEDSSVTVAYPAVSSLSVHSGAKHPNNINDEVLERPHVFLNKTSTETTSQNRKLSIKNSEAIPLAVLNPRTATSAGNQDENLTSVLLVDDMLSVLLKYKQVIRKSSANIHVAIAMNGLQALEIMKEQKFSVVFMDLQMPIMGGEECVTKIRAWEKEVNREEPQYIVALYEALDIEKDRVELASIGFNDAECKDEYKENMMKQTILKRSSLIENKDKPSAIPDSGSYPAEPAEEVKEELDTFPNKNLLLVDDSMIVRRLYERRLLKMGFAVHTAENGEEALVLLKQMPFFVVFMDLHMPVMCGKECVKALREYECNNKVDNQYIVAIFASDNAYARRNELVLCGFDDAEPKINDKATILRHVRKRARIL
mmetsp:Transcript_22622/g.31535  ORF Transcript_22622/g.31535 Transcript_22622/m.31535 type:complete len:451 (+) Transcript_22622:591-1943(+)